MDCSTHLHPLPQVLLLTHPVSFYPEFIKALGEIGNDSNFYCFTFDSDRSALKGPSSNTNHLHEKKQLNKVFKLATKLNQ